MTKPPAERMTLGSLVVPMTPVMRQRVEQEAERQDVSRAEVVRQAIAAFLPANGEGNGR